MSPQVDCHRQPPQYLSNTARRVQLIARHAQGTLYLSWSPRPYSRWSRNFRLRVVQGCSQERTDGAFFPWAYRPPGSRPHIGTPFLTVTGNTQEILYYTDHFDYFLQSQRNKHHLTVFFDELLRVLRPDLVHFQHTVHLGMEFIRQVRNTLPDAPIVYTLHEYIPICNANGQMVRTNDLSLCDRATALRCHQCFPDIAPSEFKMRELFIKSHFALVDVFLTPSRFLRQRYVE